MLTQNNQNLQIYANRFWSRFHLLLVPPDSSFNFSLKKRSEVCDRHEIRAERIESKKPSSSSHLSIPFFDLMSEKCMLLVLTSSKFLM